MTTRPRTLTALSMTTLVAALSAGCGASYPAGRESIAVAPTSYADAGDVKSSTEDYKDYGVNPFVDTAKDKLSTFAIDVDTASYSISRRKLNEGALPPQAAVRVEEFVNAFDYGYEGPKDNKPFHVELAAAPSPFNAQQHLLRVGLQAKRTQHGQRMPAHLVYLVDTSGSMQSPDKIGLVKESLRLLTDNLQQGDTVAICTYAGDTREVLAPTGIDKRSTILDAIDQLTAGGGTAMSSGIDTAYSLASKTLVKGHINRVIVLSDGDANIGPSSHEEILRQIEQYKAQGITLSTVGFGDGNYKDTMMEQLADKGDGNYSYIDSSDQARKVFGEALDGMLEVVARDVKVQVEFDPSLVQRYRLIGYENRDVADNSFRDDKVDGGEVGAGHSVTALYAIELAPQAKPGSLVTVRVRYKLEAGGQAEEISVPMATESFASRFDDAPRSFRLAAAIAGFADALRGAKGAPGLDQVREVAGKAAGQSADEAELVGLVDKAISLGGAGSVAVTAAD
ncbi:MAG: von Willebrand factor type A domain-containing protein [Polyangiaceae bacterium]